MAPADTNNGEGGPANKRAKVDLVDLAESAVKKFVNSDIELALEFLSKTVPSFCAESNDRLVKVGRCVRSLVDMKEETDLDKGLELIVEECNLLIQHSGIKVPKVRFGKTELQMPIVTLGCMRFQQSWDRGGPTITNMNMVYSDCQENLVHILKRAIDYGINHIETARGYGSSELQLGCALKQLFMTGVVKREDLIIQSKVPCKDDPNVFKVEMEKTFNNLQVDYLDLFAFHGFNEEKQWDWLFGGDGNNCWNVIMEYKKAGKIRHVGFSTHAPTDLIYKAIETEKFDYVNLHHQFCGSYTASGDGDNGAGNIKCLRLMKKLDMGAFTISGYDKGGKVYEPSRKLRSLTLPELEPMAYGSAWLWNHHELDSEHTPIHTFSVGAARAADLDQPAVYAFQQGKGLLLDKVKTVNARLEKAKIDALGSDWVDSCFIGTCKSVNSKYLVEHTQMIWMYNILKSWGMHSFCKDRFGTLVNNSKKWDPNLSREEILAKLPAWGWMPGMAPIAGQDYFADDLAGVPEKNRARVIEAYEFIAKWCSPPPEKTEEKPDSNDKEEVKKKEEEALKPPKEWESSYDMKPWKDFPDRPYP